MGALPPLMQFDFTDEEKIEIGEAIAGTDAIKRMTEECAGEDRPDGCGPENKQCIMGFPGIPDFCAIDAFYFKFLGIHIFPDCVAPFTRYPKSPNWTEECKGGWANQLVSTILDDGHEKILCSCGSCE